MPQDKPQSAPNDPSANSKNALAYKRGCSNPTAPVQALMNLGKSVVTNPAYAPRAGKTYCNFGVWTAVNVLKGYKGFTNAQGAPLVADDMIRVMIKDVAHWKASTAQDAWDNALLGGLSVACYAEAPNGHVAVVAPGPRVWSDKFQSYAPPVYNVGKTMNTKAPYTMGESFAFLYRPNHYIYIG